MKKIVAISLFVFFVFVTATIGAGLVVREINKKNSPPTNTQTTNIDNNSSTTLAVTDIQKQLLNTATPDLTLNMAEISKHNQANDCWLLISGKVYNVTSYLNSGHPGGRQAIINTCGTDATKDYVSKDQTIPNNHSQSAWAMLADYYLGNFNQVLTLQKDTAQIQSTGTTKPNTTISNTNNPSTISTIPGAQTNLPSSQIPTVNTSLTLAELTKHNQANDCWLLISGKMYNVTSYIRSHPGGSNEIIKFCGQDATVAYQTKDARGVPHSSGATNMLVAYYIGDLNQNITSEQLNTNLQQTNTAPPPTNNGEFEDD